MPAQRRKKDSTWTIIIWAINIIGGLSLLAVLIVYCRSNRQKHLRKYS